MNTREIILGEHPGALSQFADNTFDSIVTDPPYEIGFMGKSWDSSGIAYSVEFWAECLRVLKPGGHLLAFSAARTYHRMTCAIEDSGFQVRDQIMWIYGSGFPKSLDVSKAIDKAAGAERAVIGFDPTKSRPNKENFAKRTDRDPNGSGLAGWKDNGATTTAPTTEDAKKWDGWGTALKPAHEPICMARKPLVGTVATNVVAHGAGALNIDGCRIGGNVDEMRGRSGTAGKGNRILGSGISNPDGGVWEPDRAGRFPSNVILDEESGQCLDEQTGDLQSGANPSRRGAPKFRNTYGEFSGQESCEPARGADVGGASRFFYCAKASQADRAEFNNHPTVKPTDLMRYLVRLVTPKGGRVLDPFGGSGSTGKACVSEDFSFVLIDKDAASVEIARRRIAEAVLAHNPSLFSTEAA